MTKKSNGLLMKVPPRKTFELLQDFVIPKGTKFGERTGTSTYINSCYSVLIGLTKDSFGELVYRVDPDDSALSEWFKEV